jgi:hypothetical protein
LPFQISFQAISNHYIPILLWKLNEMERSWCEHMWILVLNLSSCNWSNLFSPMFERFYQKRAGKTILNGRYLEAYDWLYMGLRRFTTLW